MKESLASLKNEGVQIACITNKSLDEAKKVLAASYGEGFFDYISADDGTHPLKPDTCVVEDTLNHLGLSLQEVVFVGDTKTDMETAKRAGIKAIGCLYGFRDKKELEKSGADVMIESAKDLIPAIDYLSEE
jgi:phosphoglycolate phosphatase